jgi:hypothetical protein
LVKAALRTGKARRPFGQAEASNERPRSNLSRACFATTDAIRPP